VKYRPLNPNYEGSIEAIPDDSPELGHYNRKKHTELIKYARGEDCPACHGQVAFSEFCPVCDMDCGCSKWA
jgi:hypothetical protein